MLFLESHLSQLPSQPLSALPLSVSQCLLVLSHPTVLPAIYSINVICVVSQEDGANPLALHYENEISLRD